MISFKRLLAVLCLLSLGLVARGEGSEWGTDFKGALSEAKEHNKLVMLNFTGTDWCPWCIKLEKEILSQPEFKDYTKDKYVLNIVDFPRKKKQSAELKQQNQELQEKYGVEGYPTIVVVDANGKEVGRANYVEGGPKAFIAELGKIENDAK